MLKILIDGGRGSSDGMEMEMMEMVCGIGSKRQESRTDSERKTVGVVEAIMEAGGRRLGNWFFSFRN
jgi:hypothetical protein